MWFFPQLSSTGFAGSGATQQEQVNQEIGNIKEHENHLYGWGA
jgi:hypothetical protein